MPLDPGVLDPQTYGRTLDIPAGGKYLAPGWRKRATLTLDGNAEQSRADAQADVEQQTVGGIGTAAEMAQCIAAGGSWRDGKCQTDEDATTMWWVIGGVGVLAVIGLGTVIVVSAGKRRRRRRRRR